jgi:hypothetical protein
VSELEKVTNERDKLLEKLVVWNESGLSHVQFIEKQRTSNLKTGLGYDNTEGSPSKSNLTVDTSTSDEEFISLDDNTSSDEEYPSPTPPEYKKDKGYNAVPHPPGSFQAHRKDVSCYGVDNLEFRKKLTGQLHSEPLGESVEVPRVEEKKVLKQAVPSNTFQSAAVHSAVPQKEYFQNTSNFRKSFGHGFGMMGPKLCYVCYSPHHLIKDCDYHSEYSSKYSKTKSADQGNRETKPRDNKPVWNYTNRVNHSNFSKDYRYPHQKRPFSKPTVPSQSTDRKSSNQSAESKNSSVRPRTYNYYKPRRPYNTRKVDNPTPKVTTKWVKKESTAWEEPVLSDVKGEKGNIDHNKPTVLETKTLILDHVLKDSGDYILKEFEYVTPQGEHKSVMAWVPKRN